jgi:hypothetical protein
MCAPDLSPGQFIAVLGGVDGMFHYLYLLCNRIAF